MKHLKTITAHESPARAAGILFGDFNVVALFEFVVGSVQDSLAEWKGWVGCCWDDNEDLEDVWYY